MISKPEVDFESVEVVEGHTMTILNTERQFGFTIDVEHAVKERERKR